VRILGQQAGEGGARSGRVPELFEPGPYEPPSPPGPSGAWISSAFGLS